MRRAGAVALCAMLAAAPAFGQIKPQSSAPIDITADEAEVINSQCLAIWRGAAEALQGDARLRADVINIYGRAGSKGGQVSCGATSRIEATGRVYYVTPEQSVRGDKAVYEAAANTLVMTGDVIVAQGRNVARGSRLTVNLATRQAQMESGAKGLNKPGRVRGVFYPSQGSPAS